MNRFYPVIPKEVDEEFRRTVAIQKGFYKGALSEAILEAIQMWIKENSQSSFKNSIQGLTRNSKTIKRRNKI